MAEGCVLARIRVQSDGYPYEFAHPETHQTGETMHEEPTPGCTRCGGGRLTWRVKRTRAGSPRDSRRELLWRCAACGHEWCEPLSLRYDTVAELEPAG